MNDDVFRTDLDRMKEDEVTIAALRAENARLHSDVTSLRRAWSVLKLDIETAVNAECTCGGLGPYDLGVCPACMVLHRITAMEQARTQQEETKP